MSVLEKKLQREAPLRKVVNSDSASMQDFANPNETLRTQTVLNALGYTGPNGETVPETAFAELTGTEKTCPSFCWDRSA